LREEKKGSSWDLAENIPLDAEMNDMANLQTTLFYLINLYAATGKKVGKCQGLMRAISVFLSKWELCRIQFNNRC
jgi:hypothetical protein